MVRLFRDCVRRGLHRGLNQERHRHAMAARRVELLRSRASLPHDQVVILLQAPTVLLPELAPPLASAHFQRPAEVRFRPPVAGFQRVAATVPVQRQARPERPRRRY